ncbi:thermonuclease family protein [Planktotalea arctica]|uniref:thermonuclease family protein n=1 Tax=Planktotalea arctica TaxID=1481893 RepID=UPI000BAA2B30|nr:thermonuclease family protein [Planktotalea arctica]
MDFMIGIIIIGVLCFLAVRGMISGQSRQGNYRPPVRSDRRYRPKPFDAKTARATTKSSVLQGAAYVIDGDSIVIQKTQIRLFGIDAPEMNHPFGQKAKWALVSLCKGETVKAEISEEDVHGRTVAKCTLADGRDLSAEMVKLGLAIDWPKYSGGVYRGLETPDARKKMWLADARQKGRMHVWEQFEAKQKAASKV